MAFMRTGNLLNSPRKIKEDKTCFRASSLMNVQGKDYSAQLKIASNLYLSSLVIGNYNQISTQKT